MKLLKYNVIVSLEKRKKNDTLILYHIPIRIRIIYGGKRIDISIGCFVDYSHWDDDLKFVKANFKNKYNQTSEEINNEIKNKIFFIHNVFNYFKGNNLVPTKEEFLLKLNEESSK